MCVWLLPVFFVPTLSVQRQRRHFAEAPAGSIVIFGAHRQSHRFDDEYPIILTQ